MATGYIRDVELITNHALRSDAGMVDLIEFVFATIQQPLSMVPQIRESIGIHGVDSPFLFSYKRQGLQYAIEYAGELRQTIIELIDLYGVDSVDASALAVDTFFQIPGLGVVKAGFVAQCLGFNVGCIDSHNLVRLGIKPSAVEVRKRLLRNTQLRKIHAYVELCQSIGTAKLWDDWCAYVAGRKFNTQFTSGDEVSAFHVSCIVGDFAGSDFY